MNNKTKKFKITLPVLQFECSSDGRDVIKVNNGYLFVNNCDKNKMQTDGKNISNSNSEDDEKTPNFVDANTGPKSRLQNISNTLNEYRKLTEIMVNSEKYVRNEYVNDETYFQADNISKLEEKLMKLINNTKKSCERIEIRFKKNAQIEMCKRNVTVNDDDDDIEDEQAFPETSLRILNNENEESASAENNSLTSDVSSMSDSQKSDFEKSIAIGASSIDGNEDIERSICTKHDSENGKIYVGVNDTTKDNEVKISDKNEIAKASLLQNSSDSDETRKSNESDLSSTDSSNSDPEEYNMITKRKIKKEREVGMREADKTIENDNEISRLIDFNSLKKRNTTYFTSDSEGSTLGKENKGRRRSLKKPTSEEKVSLEQYLSDGSGNSNADIDDPADSFSELYNFFANKYERPSRNVNDELSKKILLNTSSDDNSDNSGSVFVIESKVETPKKKIKIQKPNEREKIFENENSLVDDSEVQKKKKKNNWRNNPLLRGKLSATDTSDNDESMQEKIRLPKEKEKIERNIEKSDHSDSDDIFTFQRKLYYDKKHKILSSSENEKKSSTSSIEIILEDDTKKRKKRRRKIKNVDSDDSVKYENNAVQDDNNESDTPGSTPRGRKNIRRIKRLQDVAEITRRLTKEEEERKKRIAARQQIFNESFRAAEPLEHRTELVLDFDPETKQKLVSVHPDLIKKLKPHQVDGVKFMWDSCFESLKQIERTNGGGCILAHCMGLGKTLQVITLVHTLFTHTKTKVKRVLVICPLTTVFNWEAEFEHWLKNIDGASDIEIFSFSQYKTVTQRLFLFNSWCIDGGVMLMGYDSFRICVNTTKLQQTKVIEKYHEALLDPGPDLVVCDEGHVLKNELSSVSRAAMKIKTRRRIVLTGTPLQNNLKEYHCMMQFVKPNLLGDKKEFCNRFANPITNGQYIDSSGLDVRLMKKRAHVLHKMLNGIVQRFDYNVLTPFLPEKHEFVISVALSDLQAKLYKYYIDNLSLFVSNASSKLFHDYQVMRLIWTHPLTMKLSAELKRKTSREIESDSEGSLKDFIVDGSESESGDENLPSNNGTENDKSEKAVPTTVKRKKLNSNVEHLKNGNADDLETDAADQHWWSRFITEEHMYDYKQGPKLILLFAILRECELIGDKVLVFSQSIISLDMIEYFLQRVDEFSVLRDMNEDEAKDYIGVWDKNVDYFRLDGSTPHHKRSLYCKTFNKSRNTRARLFLISTKAGGLGINLVAANRVIIFDVSWNPSHDVQSIFRVFRFGQTKPCYIYRFVSQGTMEEKIYERQVTKLSISCRVVDEQQIDRHFSSKEVIELYRFNRKTPSQDEIPMLPKDRLMAELLKEYKNIILKYHEHDSLLENVAGEDLTEEDKKQAWDEYESEKKLGSRVDRAAAVLEKAEMSKNMKVVNTPLHKTEIINALKIKYPQASDLKLEAMYRVVWQELTQCYLHEHRKRQKSVSIDAKQPNNKLEQFQMGEDALNNAMEKVKHKLNVITYHIIDYSGLPPSPAVP